MIFTAIRVPRHQTPSRLFTNYKADNLAPAVPSEVKLYSLLTRPKSLSPNNGGIPAAIHAYHRAKLIWMWDEWILYCDCLICFKFSNVQMWIFPRKWRSSQVLGSHEQGNIRVTITWRKLTATRRYSHYSPWRVNNYWTWWNRPYGGGVWLNKGNHPWHAVKRATFCVETGPTQKGFSWRKCTGAHRIVFRPP